MFSNLRASRFPSCFVCLFVTLAMLSSAAPVLAYGPLAHSVVVQESGDAIMSALENWYPALKSQRGSSSYNELRKRATAMAVAGAMLHDVGYANSQLAAFTDLLHYQGTGRFVDEFLGQLVAKNAPPETVAFALGALSHYSADRMGHYWATNRASANLLGAEALVGSRLAYEDNPDCHSCIEAALDQIIVQKSSARAREKLLEILDDVALYINSDFPGMVVEQLLRALIATYGFEQIPFAKEMNWATWFQKVVIPAYIELFQRIDVALHSADQAYGLKMDFSKMTHWPRVIAQAIKLAMKDCGPLKDRVLKSPDVKRWFDESLDSTRELFQKYLSALRGEFRQLQAVGIFMWPPDEAPPQINLDTNLPSALGNYSLADISFEFLIANSSVAKSGDIGFVREFVGRRLIQNSLYFVSTASVGKNLLSFFVSDVDRRERASATLSNPGRKILGSLSKSMPGFYPISSPTCTGAGVQTFRLGSSQAWAFGAQFICMPQNATVVETWIATLAWIGLSAGGNQKSAITPLERQFSDFLNETKYAYGQMDQNSRSRLKSLCNVAIRN